MREVTKLRAEIERERAAGTLTGEEAQAATVEIQRRILAAADTDVSGARHSSGAHKYLPPALCLAIPLFALGIYLPQGHPGLPASPFASHTAPQPREKPDFSALIAETRARLQQNPQDAEALSELGELLVLEAAEKTGVPTVTPAARDALARALADDDELLLVSRPQGNRKLFLSALARKTTLALERVGFEAPKVVASIEPTGAEVSAVKSTHRPGRGLPVSSMA